MTIGSRLTCQASIRPELSVKLRAEVGVIQRTDGIKGNLGSFPQSLVRWLLEGVLLGKIVFVSKATLGEVNGHSQRIRKEEWEGRRWNVSESGLL